MSERVQIRRLEKPAPMELEKADPGYIARTRWKPTSRALAAYNATMRKDLASRRSKS